MHILLRPINVLLLAAPFAVASEMLGWGRGLTFILAALTIIPLSGLIAGFTDALADKMGDRVGGLLEATFGNAAFLIIGFLTLREGYTGYQQVVKASIAGAIISNTLFVLGLALILGNFRNIRQTFDNNAATGYAKLLVLAVVALVLPAIALSSGISESVSEEISLIVAIILIGLYIAYLVFDLFHVKDFNYLPVVGKIAREAGVEGIAVNAENAPVVEYRAEMAANTVRREERERAPAISRSALQMRRQRGSESGLHWSVAAIGLATVTVATAYISEVLVKVTEAVTEGRESFVIGPFNLGILDVTPVFVGLVILPLIGTAAEHLSAIRSATDGRTDVTIAVTAGSALQVALLAAPLLVIASFFIGPAPLTLSFNRMELAVFGLATFLFYLVTEDGEGTWLEGAQLLAFYLIFAGTAFFLPELAR